MTRLAFALILAFNFYLVSGQNPSFKYGDVSKDEMSYSICPYDSTADAVIFFKYCKMYFLNGQVNYDVHVRMKVLTEKGLSFTTVELPYYSEENFEEIANLKGQTVNPGAGNKNVVQKISSFPDEVINKQNRIKKIIFPDVKVGSVLEYSYTKRSFDFIFPDNWVFESEHPVLLSHVSAEIPSTINYRVVYEGERSINTFGRVPLTEWSWTLRNLEALRDEPYTDNKLNYANKVVFQLAGFSTSTESDGYSSKGGYQEVAITWDKMAKEFLASDLVSTYINRGKPAADALAKAAVGDGNALAKAQKLFSYIRDNYTWNGEYAVYPQNNISKFAGSGSGNAAEVNLFLYAVLKQAGLEAYPAVTGTVNSTRVNQAIPNLTSLDHLLCVVVIEKKEYLLDATSRFHTFDMVDPMALNNSCLVLVPDRPRWTATENKAKNNGNYSCKASIKEKGEVALDFDLRFTGYKGLTYRKAIAAKDQDGWMKSFIEQAFPGATIDTYSISNLNEVDQPLDMKIAIRIPASENGKVTIHPFLLQGYTANPFTASMRRAPVYFGQPFDDNLVFMLNYSDDWELSSRPEDIQLSIPGGGMSFMYMGSTTGNTLQVVSKIGLKSSVLPVESYRPLQGLFSEIATRFNEGIVLKKK
jgi:hypothetical protein